MYVNRIKFISIYTFMIGIVFTATAVAAGDDLLSVNKTVFIQIVIFLAAIFILNTLVFKPFIALIDKRDKLTRGAIEEAKELEQKVKDIIKEYDGKLHEARLVAAEERSLIVHEAQVASNEVITKARAQAGALMDDAKVKLEAETKEMKEMIKGDIDGIAKDIASQVLGKEVQV